MVALGVVANAGRQHWQRVGQLLEGVEAADADLLPELGASLATMGRRWEFFLARMHILAERAGEFHAGDRESVARCDHFFHQLMTKFEPGYELLPTTITRLL
jgi:hypothetical protein